MEVSINILIFIFLSIINIRYYYEEKKETLYLDRFAHPIDITYDFSSLPKKENFKYLNQLIRLLDDAKKILSSLLLSTNSNYLKNNSQILSSYNITLLTSKKESIITDIIIVPILKRFIRRKNNLTFEAEIIKEYKNSNIPPIIAYLYINNRTNFRNIFYNKNSKYLLLLKSLRALTDCFGLSLQFIKKIKQPKNNYFQTPPHLLANSYSYKSILKLYNFLEKPIPQHNISINGEFYIKYWENDSIVKDFRNEVIDLKSDLSEISMNLFNDMNNYKLAECDFQKYYYNGICYRIDQKCLSLKEIRTLYFLNFGINTKGNEIICYLSNPENIKKNQCGTKYGHLLRDNLNFCPISQKIKFNLPKIEDYEIPELEHIKSQTLNLLKPSEQCKNVFPRTIFFNYENRTDIIKDNISIETITLNESDKKYFVTYLTEYETYFNRYVEILKTNGLIRSYYHNKNHNLFIKYFYSSDLKGEIGLNQYQRCFQFIGYEIFFHKNELYSNYLNMKTLFPEFYNYMPTTYIYPEDKKTIKAKFKNYKVDINDLWIVKPTNSFSGKGIHLFESLKQESNKKYIISKYISNPHLIKGRKYDLRIYVLITSFKPLRIYFNKEGLVRIAADKYFLINDTIHDKYVHLTNTAINSYSKNYVYPKDVNDENANKWNLNTYRKYLNEQNIDYDLLFNKIKDITIKTIISGQSAMNDKMSELNVASQSMFNLFGFDILINDNLEPILLEVNTRPFMFIYDRMDKVIKTNLFIDILNIIGIAPFSHQKESESFEKTTKYANKVMENVNYALCEISRPKGDFELIFPLKENINYYRELFKGTNEENILFWKEIINGK